MFIFSLPWNLRGTQIRFAPESGGASPAAAAAPATEAAPTETAKPAENLYTADDVEGLGEGAELLLGAKRDGGVQDDDDLPDEWTEENAGGEVESGKEKGENEEAAEAAEGEEEKAAPELTALQTQLAEATAERERLAAELETLKAAGPQTAPPVPASAGPLGNVSTDDALRSHERLAIDAEEWADENREGGELPRELQARLEGKKPDEIGEPRMLTGSEAMQLLKNAKRMLREHLPARREYLQSERGIKTFWQQHHPEYLDKAKPEGQMVAALERQWPHLKTNPAWFAALAAMARGSRAFEEEAKGKGESGKAKVEKAEPLAPVPPRSNGSRTSTGKPTTQRPVKLRANMSDEELAATM